MAEVYLRSHSTPFISERKGGGVKHVDRGRLSEILTNMERLLVCRVNCPICVLLSMFPPNVCDHVMHCVFAFTSVFCFFVCACVCVCVRVCVCACVCVCVRVLGVCMGWLCVHH